MNIRILFLLVLITLSSCGYNTVYFDETLQQVLSEHQKEIKTVQFYTSDKIILEREVSDKTEVTVEGGKIRFRDGKYFERIKIKKKTPGVCTYTENNLLAIRFENGENRDITFQVNEDFGNLYRLEGLNTPDYNILRTYV